MIAFFRREDVTGGRVAQDALENFLRLRLGHGVGLLDGTDAAKRNLYQTPAIIQLHVKMLGGSLCGHPLGALAIPDETEV